MPDKTPADSGSRERALGWLVEELQLDEVMVFVAKLVSFLVVCGICSVTVVVGLLPFWVGECESTPEPQTRVYRQVMGNIHKEAVHILLGHSIQLCDDNTHAACSESFP